MGGTCEVMSCTVGIWKHARLRLEETQLVSDKLRPFKKSTSPAFLNQFFKHLLTHRMQPWRFHLSQELGYLLNCLNHDGYMS